MKYLKRFNESESFKNSYNDSNSYHSLIDNGFEVFYESYKISIGKKNTPSTLIGDVAVSKDFKWEDVESDVIPLLEELTYQYNIFDNTVIFISTYENYEFTLEDVINDNIDIPASVYNIDTIISIEIPFKSPGDNKDFKDNLVKFLEGIGFEDIECGDEDVTFHNNSNEGLTNSKSSVICDFIDKYGYESYDFTIYGSYIEFPSY
jgi:hypothetical protein